MASAQSGYGWVRNIGRNSIIGSFQGVVPDGAGNLYVTDANSGCVEMLDLQGNLLTNFGSLSGGGKIARDGAGNLYFADFYNNRIQILDARGHYVGRIGAFGTRAGQFSNPVGLRLDASGNIYVTEYTNNRVQKLSPKGSVLLKFGSAGSGNGQFKTPQGVAVDASGNLYVADSGNNRIQIFSATGAFVAAFGSQGAGNGQFSNPTDVAVDSTGNIYVSDQGNARIQKFSSNGTLVASLALSISPSAVTLDSAGTLYVGSTNGGIALINAASMHLKYTAGGMTPNYLFVDGAGNTYVTDDRGSFRKFDPTGKVLQSTPTPNYAQGVVVDGTGNVYVADGNSSQILKYPAGGGAATTLVGPGNGTGQVSGPRGLVLDGSGNLYVADFYNNRIDKFTTSGSFVAMYGAAGTGNGQFSNPGGIALDGSGNIYIADTGNNRIQKLSPKGAYLLQFGTAGTGNGQLKGPTDLTLDGSGNIYVADTGNNRIQKFSATGAFVTAFGSQLNGPNLFAPNALRFDQSGNLLVADRGNSRIVKLTTSGQVLGAYDGFGSNYAYFSNPRAIRLDSNNNLYVANNTWGEKLTTSGNWLGNFGSFKGTSGLALDTTGNIYVVDNANNNVQVFNSSLTNTGMFGTTGSTNGAFNGPVGIAADSSGNLYVTDAGNYRVQVFTSAFAYSGQFGSQGTGDGQFMQPAGLTITSNGNLLVVDSNYTTSWVNLFGLTSGFPFLGSFGFAGSAYGQFNTPYDVAVDGIGNIYVADSGNGRVQMFDPNANFLFSMGTPGGGSGQLANPVSVAVDPAGFVYVADSGTNRVSIFGPVPLVTTINPTTVPAASVAQSLSVSGSGFTPDAVVTFNGLPLTTTFISGTSLKATLPAAQLATAGTYPVTVLQAAGAGNALPFTVSAPLPILTGLSPTSISAGATAFTLTVNGSSFVNGAQVKFGSSVLPTTFVSANQLTASVSASLLTTPGTVPVSVQQGGLTSATQTFTINAVGAPPTLTSVTPPTADKGSAAVTLTLTGTNFTTDAVVKFNGAALVTSFVSATQLTAILPASMLTTAGYFTIVVAEASGTSNAVGFSVDVPGPVLSTISPLSAHAGSPAINLSVTGLNFTSDAVVRFNGTALATSFVSSTQVVANIPATLLVTAGLFPVVLTQASGSTDTVAFAVNIGQPVVSGMNPTFVTHGSATLTLTISGSNFTSDAVVSFNGTPLTTTFGSSTSLTATVPASLLKSFGIYPVVVRQASGSSRTVAFLVL